MRAALAPSSRAPRAAVLQPRNAAQPRFLRKYLDHRQHGDHDTGPLKQNSTYEIGTRPCHLVPGRDRARNLPSHRSPSRPFRRRHSIDRRGRRRGVRGLLCVGPDPAHAGCGGHPQVPGRAADGGAVGRRQGAGRLQARRPQMGQARRHLAARDRGAGRDRGSPLLRAPRHRRAAHGHCAVAHPARRPRRRLDHHPAIGAQPLPRGNRPRADAHPQAQGSDHRTEDREGLQQGRDPGDLPQHGAVPLQQLRHRTGRAHLLRQAGAASSTCWKARR